MSENLMLVGALCFGIIIGWQVYFINRYRTAAVDFGDLATVIGIVGGGAVLANGVGLALGYFGYFLVLLSLVRRSQNFDSDWFLDGRRRAPQGDFLIPEGTRMTSAAMGETPPSGSRGGPQV
jgi:hypothetical protein